MAVRIPTRFEMMLNKKGFDPTPLIVAGDDDLAELEHLRRTMEVQQGGVLGLLYGSAGVGKTTSVYSLAALMSEKYESVFLVPSTVPLRDLSDWLSATLPLATHKALPVLFDNREVTDDEVGLRQVMAGLNALSRRRADVMMLWPTTDKKWRDELRSVARTVGGRSLIPMDHDIAIQGPQREAWREILERLLVQLDQSFDELAISEETVEECATAAGSVGEFLENVRDKITVRVDEVQLTRKLPTVLFVISSGAGVVGEANRLRRAKHLHIKADELLAYSPKSVAGKYWKARLKDPNHHLAYITTLFQARLVTMGPSSVVHSALEYGDSALAAMAKNAGVTKNSANAGTTFRSTDFHKFLTATNEFELTSTSKGTVSPEVRYAYKAIQASSPKRHKAINQSICALAQKQVPEFRADLGRFEVDLGAANAFADAVIPLAENPLHLEFHHLSEAHCQASSMSSYIMNKLQTYALHYNLIPR